MIPPAWASNPDSPITVARWHVPRPPRHAGSDIMYDKLFLMWCSTRMTVIWAACNLLVIAKILVFYLRLANVKAELRWFDIGSYWCLSLFTMSMACTVFEIILHVGELRAYMTTNDLEQSINSNTLVKDRNLNSSRMTNFLSK